MLYDGALGAINRARGAIESGDVVAKGRAVDKALAIDPDHVRSRRKLGAVALKLGEPDTARVAAESPIPKSAPEAETA